VCCSVLHCVAVYTQVYTYIRLMSGGSLLQCVAVRCSLLIGVIHI